VAALGAMSALPPKADIRPRVAYVVIIAAIAVMVTLIQIYLQNPR